MPKLIMCKGLPASGKTTWAKQQIDEAPKNSIKRVNKDDLRAMLDNSQWSKGNEDIILGIRDNIIKLCLFEGKHVIVDDTNLHPKHEARLREIAKKCNASFIVQDFTNVTLEDCLDRDRHRPNPVGSEVIYKMFDSFLKEEAAEINKRPIDPELPWAVIVDIDGTLAYNDGHRGWYEYDKVAEDTCHEHIKELVINIADQYTIIVVSGREDSCRDITLAWLNNNFIPYDELHMRKTGDHRKDDIVKKELFNEHIADKYNVLFALDDRNRVVDMWRKELHIPCLQVNYGDF